MPDLGAFGPALAIGLVLLVMLWFTFGTQRNVRLGNDYLRWLQSGLPRIGRRTTLRWLGSSVVELSIQEATEPFRAATVLVALEPRDVGLLWAFARSRGRRDFVIVRADLRRPPRFSAELSDPAGWTGGEGSDGMDGLERVGWAPEGVVAYADRAADEDLVRGTWERLGTETGGVWRLRIQPVVPHVEVHFRPPDIDAVPADRPLTTIRKLAVELESR
jgi:hypothetical protein